MAPYASVPKPEGLRDLGPNGPNREAMVASRHDPSPLLVCALRRQDPRQEPSALVAHARICAGGAGQPAPLPR